MLNFYVYIIFRPNGIPCYVGKGMGRRFKRHFHSRRKHRNPHLARIIALAGGSLPVVKIRENISEADAHTTEIALIAAIGREAHGGPLVNLTDGGEGTSGHSYRPTSEQKARLKLVMNRPDVIEKLRKGSTGNTINNGRIHSHRSKSNMRAAKIGIPLSESHRTNIRNAMRSPETVEKLRRANLGKKHKARPPLSEDTRQRMSASHKGVRPTEETRAKMKAAQLRRWARTKE